MAVPDAVRARWSRFEGAEIHPLSGGLINETFVVECAPRVVLQKQHPVFGPEVNEDIDAITRHLAGKGLVTPRLVRPDDGAACVLDGGEVWRAITLVEGGRTFHEVPDPALARAAGHLVGRFHAALADLEHDYRHSRGNVHDTAKHRATLRAALEAHEDHRLYDEVAPLADEVLAPALPDFSALPARHCHGDLKISNLLFRDEEPPTGLCLVDLDTLSRMILPFELGDALRSWCNPAGEDAPGRLELPLLTAAIAGYAETAPRPTPEEVELLIDGLATIALELSARFLADALNEAYFGWDAARFSSRGEHNLVRARSQLGLYRSVIAQAKEARDALAPLRD